MLSFPQLIIKGGRRQTQQVMHVAFRAMHFRGRGWRTLESPACPGTHSRWLPVSERIGDAARAGPGLVSTQISGIWPDLDMRDQVDIEVSVFYPGERPMNQVWVFTPLPRAILSTAAVLRG